MSKTARQLGAALVLLLVASWASACSDDPEAAEQDSSQAAAVDALVQQGLEQLGADDAEAARSTFEQVVDLDPDNKYALFNLGVIAQQGGDLDAARDQYDEALAADDAFAPALYNRAILAEDEDLETAVGLYERALDADPEMAAAHMRLGFALLHLGRDEEGSEHLGEGVSLDPSMADVEAPSYS